MCLLLAMCTTMDARITIIIAALITTTIVARTSAPPSRRAGLHILLPGTATRAADNLLTRCHNQPGIDKSAIGDELHRGTGLQSRLNAPQFTALKSRAPKTTNSDLPGRITELLLIMLKTTNSPGFFQGCSLL